MTSLLMTETSKKNDLVLKRIPYIYYLIWFKKNEIQALINLGSKVNAITSTYTLKLGFQVYRINVRA